MTNIFEIDSLEEYIDARRDLRDCVIQGLDLSGEAEHLASAEVAGAVFLGCSFGAEGLAESLRGRGAVVFPAFGELPYGTFDLISPMVFPGGDRWVRGTGIYPLLERLAGGRQYAGLLHLSDDPDEVVRFIVEHPPVPKV